MLASKTASAQEWLKDRRFSEGAGIKTGDVELHPGIAAEVGYDSNYFYRSHRGPDPSLANGDPNAPVRDAGVIRVTPQFYVSSITSQRREGGGGELPSMTFRVGTAVSVLKLIGKEVADSTDPLNAYGNVNGRVDILPSRPFGAGIFAGYTRTLQASTVGNPDLSFNRSDVNAGLELIVIPGGGTLDMRLGYQFFGAFFEQSQGVPFTNYTHEISARNRWKFRPRTALFHDTSLRFIHYPNRDRAINTLHDSTPLRTRIGLNGLVTSRFAFLAAVGYGASFHRGGPAVGSCAGPCQFDTVTGQVQGTFYLSGAPDVTEPTAVSLSVSSISVGYVRDYANSYLGDFYGSDRGYLQFLFFYAGRLLGTATAGVAALNYPAIYQNTGPGGTPVQVLGNGVNADGFTDVRLDSTLYLEYRFTDVFGLNATFKYDQNFSDARLPAGTGLAGQPLFYDMAWRRFQALLGARVLW